MTEGSLEPLGARVQYSASPLAMSDLRWLAVSRLFPALTLLLTARGVGAQVVTAREPRPASASSAVPATALTQAREHFERARTSYERGAYRSAIAELERAVALDPTGKDLVFNLALVHEKLGDLDRAIHYFERYRGMEPDPEESRRVESILERVRGARAELIAARERKRLRAPASPSPARPSNTVPLEAWIAASGALTLTATTLGTYFGIQALIEDSKASEPTNSATSIHELHDHAEAADRHALLADVSLGVGLVSGAVALGLYWLRMTTTGPNARVSSTVGKAPVLEIRF